MLFDPLIISIGGHQDQPNLLGEAFNQPAFSVEQFMQIKR